MNKVVRLIMGAVLWFAPLFCGLAQDTLRNGFLWGVDYNTVFDNREGNETYSENGTYFLMRFSPEVGIRFLDDHEVRGGVSYIQPIGIGYKQNKFCPTFYYTYTQPKKRVWSVSVGMIPRYRMVEPAHKILWSDTMNYYNPNIRGVLLQCVKDSFYAEVFLDWRSLQSEEQREAFNVNLNMEGMPCKLFFVGGKFQLNHLAKQRPAPEGQGVNDDIFANPYVGLDFKSVTPLDSFRIRAGLSIFAERCRALSKWHLPKGFLCDIIAEWKKIGLKETIYAGENCFPLYGMYGSLLNMGEPYFQDKFYSYTSLYANIVRNQMVNFQCAVDVHATNAGIACYQKILVRANIDSDKWRNRAERHKGWIHNIY